MAQDVAAGRPTEVAQIFGDLARRGRRHAVATPRTDLIANIISGIDVGRGPGGAERGAVPPGGRAARATDTEEAS
jgi:hypothetical protein